MEDYKGWPRAKIVAGQNTPGLDQMPKLLNYDTTFGLQKIVSRIKNSQDFASARSLWIYTNLPA